MLPPPPGTRDPPLQVRAYLNLSCLFRFLRAPQFLHFEFVYCWGARMLFPQRPDNAFPEKKSSWTRPRLTDLNGVSGHKVSFSGSSKSTKSSNERAPSQISNSSRSSSPQTTPSARQRSDPIERSQVRNWQRINRQSEALWLYVHVRRKLYFPVHPSLWIILS